MKKRVLSVILAFGIIFSNSSVPFATIAEDGTPEATSSEANTNEDQIPNTGDPQDEEPTQIDDDQPEDKPGDDPEPSQPDQAVSLEVGLKEFDVYKGQKDVYIEGNHIKADYITVTGDGVNDELKQQIAETITADMDDSQLSIKPGSEEISFNGRTYCLSYSIPAAIEVKPYVGDVSVYSVNNNRVLINDNEKGRFCISNDPNSFDENKKEIGLKELDEHKFYLKNIKSDDSEFKAISEPLLAYEISNFCKDGIRIAKNNNVYCGNDRIAATNQNVDFLTSINIEDFEGEKLKLRLYYDEANGEQPYLEIDGEKQERTNSGYTFNGSFEIGQNESQAYKIYKAELYADGAYVGSTKDVKFKDTNNSEFDKLIVDKIAPKITDIEWKDKKAYITLEEKGSEIVKKQHRAVGVKNYEDDDFENAKYLSGHNSAYRDENGKWVIDFSSILQNIHQEIVFEVRVQDAAGNWSDIASSKDFAKSKNAEFDGKDPTVKIMGVYFDESGDGETPNWKAVTSLNAYQYGIYANKPVQIKVKAYDDEDEDSAASRVEYRYGDRQQHQKNGTRVYKTVTEEGSDTSKEVPTNLYELVLQEGRYQNVTILAYDDGGNYNGEHDSAKLSKLSDLLKEYFKDFPDCPSDLYIESDPAEINVQTPDTFADDSDGVWYGIETQNAENNKFTITVKDTASGIKCVEVLDNDKTLSASNEAPIRLKYDSDSRDINSTFMKQDFTGRDKRTEQCEIEIPLSVFADGEHTLTVKVTDNAGNVNTYFYINKNGKAVKFSFHTDFTAPTGSLKFDSESKPIVIKEQNNEQNWFNGCASDATVTKVGFEAVFDEEQSPAGIEYAILNAREAQQRNENGGQWNGTWNFIAYDPENPEKPFAFDDTGITIPDPESAEHKLTVLVKFIDKSGNPSGEYELIYYKDLERPEIGSVTVDKVEGSADKILRVLTFGIYSNYQIQYTVRAHESSVFDSGLNDQSVRIEYTLNGESEATAMKVTMKEDGVYTAVLDPKNASVFSGEIAVSVTDIYGLHRDANYHTTDEFDSITEGEKQTSEKTFMIETVPPVIQCDLPTSDGHERSDNEIWYKDDKKIQFTVSDANSGIASVEVMINGNKLENDSAGASFLTDTNITKDRAKEVEYWLSTDNLHASNNAADGCYKLQITAQDYAGNVTTVEREYHIDKKAPKIENISFSIASADNYNSTDEYPAEEKFIEYLEYGYYFHEAFTATVHVTDEAPSSGLYEVKYTFIPYQNGEKGEEYGGTASIDANGNASFDVAKDYKGQIRVMASDYVGNESDKKNPHAFVVDSMDVHEAETHIEISGLDGTSFKDQSQHPLYDRDVNLTVKIIDKQSGIREIKYSMKSEQDNQDERVITIANTDVNMDQDLGDGWKVTGMDANLVTEVTRDYHFTSDNNDMQLLFAMTDRANNSSSRDSDVFSIDKTAPVIDVVFAPTPGSGTYYREARTATITVTERNFDASRINATIETVGGTVPTLSFKDNSKTEHVAELTFLEGDYTFSIDGTDLCNHNATVKYSGGNEQKFTVDLTDPIETDNFDQFKNNRDNSFNVNKEMTFTVTEHNFVPEAVNIHIYRVPAGEEFTASGRKDCTEEYLSKSKWTDTGDSHTISFTFSEDYVYQVSINASDAAGRTLAEKTSPVFEIDKTAPVLKTPTDLEKIAYTAKDKASSAKPIQFEDKNLVGVKYTVVSYRMKRNEDQVGYDMDITSKDHDTKTDSVVLDKDYFAQDGIYEVMCTAYDVAGNVSKKSTHTFIIQRDSDFLVYIPESDKEAHTGLYEFNERGVRSAEFKDINIVAYLAKEKNFEVQVDGTAVTEPDIETEVQDTLINQVNVYDVTLRNSFISNNYNSEEIDTDLMLNAVATGEGKEQVITLGHIYIDNVKPAGEYESTLQNLGFFDGFYGMDSRIATLEGVSPDIDVDKCEIMLNDATLKSEDGGFTYDENAHTITFRLNRGYNDIRPTLVDMAGNVNTLDVVKNVYVGGVFARWWFLFILGGLVVAAIPTVLIILAIRKKKYSV